MTHLLLLASFAACALQRPAPRAARRMHAVAASFTRLAAASGGGWDEAGPEFADEGAAGLAWADEGDLDVVPAPPRKKRDRSDKSPNRLGKAGLKGFVPSANDRDKVRPSLDDVTRISFGEKAKRRGVGSRATPHRLNADERAEYDRAIARGYLTLQGRGYRKERKGSPLLNIWRQRSDATGVAAVWLELGAAGGPRAAEDGSPVDTCAVDFAPLRDGAAAARALALAVREAAPYVAAAEAERALTDVVIGDVGGPPDEALATQPIWNVPFHEARFDVRSRADGKSLAAELVRALAGLGAPAEGGEAEGAGAEEPRVPAGKDAE